ncbi:DOPA 4,5-dioxygenase family protein [Vibrio sinaloensis]|uniref:DOPA 4,5-dioxygenase family protein n=1 Tax=Photobacterium sp. (strain ATCC 43367) TaxID=379097 RepID=UPI00057FC706|nr:DOPA 4,5-dioxygenase family protein [Vibrio sinaloensis]KHT46595.1 4,5-dioxygenase [Vibrio sinaloensis]
MSYPKNLHQHYHAHVYFDEHTSDIAYSLRDYAREELELSVGRFNRGLVGPHLSWSFSIDFDSKQFDKVIDWLDKNRQEMSVLVHAVTDNEYQDHTDFAYWLGESLPLKLSIFEA